VRVHRDKNRYVTEEWKRRKPPEGQPSSRLPVASASTNVKYKFVCLFVFFSRQVAWPGSCTHWQADACPCGCHHCIAHMHETRSEHKADPGRAEHETLAHLWQSEESLALFLFNCLPSDVLGRGGPTFRRKGLIRNETWRGSQKAGVMALRSL